VLCALRGLYWTWKTGSRWAIGPFALCLCTYVSMPSVVGVSVDPPDVGRDWGLVSSNKARGYCCPIAAEARSPAVFTCTWCSASREPTPDSRRSGVGLALAPRPQALPMPALLAFVQTRLITSFLCSVARSLVCSNPPSRRASRISPSYYCLPTTLFYCLK
jgi:hypothetical protein